MADNQILYLDGTATTKPSKIAVDAFNDICENHWLNPSSMTYSIDAHNKLQQAREAISDWICCRPDQIFFTSGSTESANWVVQTFAPRWDDDKVNYVFYRSPIEHPCVENSLNFMDRCGYEVIDIPVDGFGRVDLRWLIDQLESDITPNKLVCVMDSNNELGTIEPTRKIADICRRHGAKLMTDMTQSFANSSEIDVTHLGMDFAFGSAQKFGCPRGAGFLYVREPEKLEPFIYGGHQESGLRAGTENLAGIYAMAKQFEEIAATRFGRENKIQELKTYLLSHLPDGVTYNCPRIDTLQSIVSLEVPIDANELIVMLSMKGIYLSAGSACSTGENKPSRILRACGFSDDRARRTIRVSLNADLTTKDIDRFLQEVRNCLNLGLR